MIFLLDIIFAINIIFAYKVFRCIIAPPVLLGLGMLLASLVATIHYGEWQMNVMLLESVMLLGGSTLLYTFICVLLKNKDSYPRYGNLRKIELSLNNIRIIRVEFVLVLLILIGVISFYLKLHYYAITFGRNLGFSDLVFSARFDGWIGDNMLHIPKYVVWMANLVNYTQYFSCWLLSICILSKEKNKLLSLLLLLHISIVVADGVLTGTKGAMLDPIMKFITIYLFLLFVTRRSYTMPIKTLALLIIVGVIFAASFSFLSTIIGRDMEWKKNSDVLSTYVGAEIKNFDIYIHGNDGNAPNKKYGEETFFVLYKNIDPEYIRYPRVFQEVGNCGLGNVYTQLYSFHKDFGVWGVIIMTIMEAVLSMLIYNRAILIVYAPKVRLNLSLIIYANMVMPIFMSFFSSRFSELVFTISFLKLIVYEWILLILLTKYFEKKKLIIYEKYNCCNCDSQSIS